MVTEGSDWWESPDRHIRAANGISANSCVLLQMDLCSGPKQLTPVMDIPCVCVYVCL